MDLTGRTDSGSLLTLHALLFPMAKARNSNMLPVATMLVIASDSYDMVISLSTGIPLDNPKRYVPYYMDPHKGISSFRKPHVLCWSTTQEDE